MQAVNKILCQHSHTLTVHFTVTQQHTPQPVAQHSSAAPSSQRLLQERRGQPKLNQNLTLNLDSAHVLLGSYH
jgi:hypothetical protein